MNDGRWQISNGGGRTPLWARNGGELFYVAPDSAVMRVPVEGGSTFRFGSRTKLFDGRYVTITPGGRNYDVSPDGQRFLMIKQAVDRIRRRPHRASSSCRTGLKN